MLYLLFIAVALIFAFDGVPLIKQKKWAELAVFTIITASACVLLIDRQAGIPAPLDLLNNLLRNYGKNLFG